MKTAIWISLLFGLFSSGCAHNRPEASPATPVAKSPAQTVQSQIRVDDEVRPEGKAADVESTNDNVTLSDETREEGVNNAQIPSEEGEIEAEFQDDDLDFLDEEAEAEVYSVADPLAPWNRMMFHFNDKLYFWFLKPVSTRYETVVPTPVRAGVSNFFTNLATPIRMGSCLLQGKGKEAGAEFARFMFNTTFGVLGFRDPAKDYPELNPHDEDLGQTLGTYGVGNGCYIVWPILGPSTLRDTVGTVGDVFMGPISYLPLGASIGITAEKKLNETSFRKGDYESLKEAAIEPYEALRDAYIQHRQTKVEE